MKSGILYVVGTPIGNMEDITIRAIKVLLSESVIACEDSRRTSLLIQTLINKYPAFVPGPVAKKEYIVINDYTENQQTPVLTGWLLDGSNIVLVSDAGTPLVSDPGFKLIQSAILRGIPVAVIPGVSAVTSSLSISGFPAHRFLYLGYLPEKEGKRTTLLKKVLELKIQLNEQLTLVIFAPPHKMQRILESMYTTLGDIDVAMCSELTKIHEKVRRGKLKELVEENGSYKGEYTIVASL